MSKSWQSTLRLPKSSFPNRPRLHERKQYILRCTDDFYEWQAANRPADNEFLLHDGPPYANGELHAGHALNKILKDMINRVKVQQGRRVKYVPGWDCHGLPIEMKVVEAAEGGKKMSPGGIRKAARKLASSTVKAQMNSFKSYAVMADWENKWTTMDTEFEIRQLRLFQKMARKGLIYRKHKPVYWSPSSATALAEAELEYNEAHVSKSAWVRLPIVSGWQEVISGLEGVDKDVKLYAVIWTTTPWTLPANQAIAVRDDMTYSIVRFADYEGLHLVSIPEGSAGGDLPEISEVLGKVQGSELTRLRYLNPLLDDLTALEGRPIIHAPFVRGDSGTGMVHCAPGHGFDDYLACEALGIPAVSHVDNEGRFTDKAYPRNPDLLGGIPVLEGGSDAVLDLLGNENGYILKVKYYKHKYPYDWRTKKPIIIRATAQWFADVGSIKEQALAALEEVRFVPETGKNRLEAFVKGRSEWCISRQRSWGVPIPALYDANGNAVVTDESIDHIISVIRERKIDAWWFDDAHDPAWLPESLRDRAAEFRRGQDTMDVWFDSGSSWTQTDKQADVYLEGSDQHRGWFQSSLLTRVAAMVAQDAPGGSSTTNTLGLSPFKTLITHGFTLDKDGKKMSKSLGNIISANEVMDGSLLFEPPQPGQPQGRKNREPEALGPDALRLWIATSDYTGDIILGKPVLRTVHQVLLKYRTIIKMFTGSMQPDARTAPLTVADHIALIQLKDVMQEVGKYYDNYEFNKAQAALSRWVVNDVSAFYLETLKDRLYCGDSGGVLEPIFNGLLRMLAPVTPVLVEEAWEYRPQWMKDDASLVHPLKQLYDAPLIEPVRLSYDEKTIRESIPAIMAAHGAIKAASERARLDKVLGSSLGCSVVLVSHAEGGLAVLERFKDELDAIFVVSAVDIVQSNGGETPKEVEGAEWKYSEVFEVGGKAHTAYVLPPKQHKCPRCWRYVAPVEDALCGRCGEVVEARAGEAAKEV
ncbi:Putative isoleucyl-tRNA synthetase [Podospora comata]|uniref:isoleucine--tRNA ligase n=1 Tax=Podospora comata TaxID=48703 RepID=A0ABY6RTD5_PODCO|nr:Putative isoleucyl-tRNA synthetase [Podospora comata]